MMLYDLRCAACGHIEEYLVRAGKLLSCTACKCKLLERIPSAPGMVKTNMNDKPGFKQR